ncbi:hypothetical protein NL676_012391 [Syzygium grande]|nr:hypothetical protein NL676_012391 [Syzygium grande]
MVSEGVELDHRIWTCFVRAASLSRHACEAINLLNALKCAGFDLPIRLLTGKGKSLVSEVDLFLEKLHPLEGNAALNFFNALEDLLWAFELRATTSWVFQLAIKKSIYRQDVFRVAEKDWGADFRKLSAGSALFSGINGVCYYAPQILEEVGVEDLANLGISSKSASFLISAFTTFLMLPCIAVGMRLMDTSGRRTLLLTTIPVLIVTLVALVIVKLVGSSLVVSSLIATICVVVYFCCFMTAYGPIPNILCSEIFPTRVRGLCITICALVFWIGDIIVTDMLPVLLDLIGLAGIFGIYAVVCVISWVFVFLKVPETKGMPLEVIIEFFSVETRQIATAKN